MAVIFTVVEVAPDGNCVRLSNGEKYLVRQEDHPISKNWAVGKNVIVVTTREGYELVVEEGNRVRAVCR